MEVVYIFGVEISPGLAVSCFDLAIKDMNYRIVGTTRKNKIPEWSCDAA